MAYRKFNADQLFTGHTMLGNDWVLVTESDTVVDIIPLNEAGEGIESFTGILSPGFINCHCHLELSHMKGVIPPKTGMAKFLLTVMTSRTSTPEEINESMAIAERFMIERGIVAVGDICNTADSLEVKSGRNLYYHNFVEATGFIAATASKRFDMAKATYDAFRAGGMSASIVPHAPYSVSDKLFALMNEFESDSILSIHNQESEAEAEFFATGKGPLTELFKFLNVDIAGFAGKEHNSLRHCLQQIAALHPLILVHNVHTSIDDLQWVCDSGRMSGLYWCLCPNANLYINDRLPDVEILKRQGCQLVVGTDSLASNIELNILEEIKTLQEHFPTLSTTELLTWATINGALALRINERYGSFDKGKTPGIVVIDGGRKGMLEGSVAKKVL